MKTRKIILVTSDFQKKKQFVRDCAGDNSYMVNADVNTITHQSVNYEIWNIIDLQLHPESFVKDADGVIIMEPNIRFEKYLNSSKLVVVKLEKSKEFDALQILEKINSDILNKTHSSKGNRDTLFSPKDENEQTYIPQRRSGLS